MSQGTVDIPKAHIDDELATRRLTEALGEMHRVPYGFAVRRWDGSTVFESDGDRVTCHVVIDADDASTTVHPGDPVRGPPPEAPYHESKVEFPVASETHTAAVRPGDVIVLQPDGPPVELTGAGATFEVRTPQTAYPAPRFGFLRNVTDDPGGCAEYEGAFRREMLPPEVSTTEGDTRGVNRVNQHTLDMRHDREPTPVQHCHAPVTAGDVLVPHTETAVVLDRSTYDRPPVEKTDSHIRVFRHPREDPTDWVDLPVEPGSIVVTPATEERVYGHCFRNTFATLVAVPGFTAPLIELGADADREGKSHRKYHE